MWVSALFLLLVPLATGEVIDLTANGAVANWPSSSENPRINITMCWGEFILESTAANSTTLTIDTNIWKTLNIDGDVVTEVDSNLAFDFSKFDRFNVPLGFKQDVYLRVRLSVPSRIVVERIWTTGLFDFYPEEIFPEDVNLGSNKGAIGKTSDPPEELKTIPVNDYPEGGCSRNYGWQPDTVFIIAVSTFGVFLFFSLCCARAIIASTMNMTRPVNDRVGRAAYPLPPRKSPALQDEKKEEP